MKGWRYESYRHSLAARGVSMRRYSMAYNPAYVVSDMPLIIGDAIGTAGAATVGLIPIVVGAGVLYGGANYVSKRKSLSAKRKRNYGEDVEQIIIPSPSKANPKAEDNYIKQIQRDDVPDSFIDSLKLGSVVEGETMGTEIANLVDLGTGKYLYDVMNNRRSFAVKKVDLSRYQGKWKQVSVKNEPWFQKGCKNVTAKYKLKKDGTMSVTNKCDGREIKGTARSVSDDNRKLKVDFGFPFAEGDYNIVKVDKDYKNATVRGGKTVWKLRRVGMSAKLDSEKYKRWKKLVNMSPSELKSFMSRYGSEAGLSRSEASAAGIKSGRDSARAIIRMKEKGKDNWNENDIKWMNRQISFVSRMKGARGPLYDDKGEPTRKLLALKVWGHNPQVN